MSALGKQINDFFSLTREQYEELTALRAWKAKARPFLEEAKERYQDKLNDTRISNFYNDNAKDVLIRKHNSQIRLLTELLGGSDERND